MVVILIGTIRLHFELHRLQEEILSTLKKFHYFDSK